MKNAHPGGSVFFCVCVLFLFLLAQWEDKRLRGTGDIIVICIAIKICCESPFTAPTSMSKLHQEPNGQTFNFIPAWISERVNRKTDWSKTEPRYTVYFSVFF